MVMFSSPRRCVLPVRLWEWRRARSRLLGLAGATHPRVTRLAALERATPATFPGSALWGVPPEEAIMTQRAEELESELESEFELEGEQELELEGELEDEFEGEGEEFLGTLGNI